MALITCPECKKEISDKSTVCIHCGYPINLEKTNIVSSVEECKDMQTATSKTDVSQVINVQKYKKIIISIVIIVAVIICIIYGLNLVSKYQDILKNPDSLILRSDIAVITYSRDGETYEYAFFDASGENSYGASVTSTPCFVNGQYVCNSDDIPSVSEYMSMDDDEARLYLGIELALAHWNLYGEDAATENEDVTDSFSASAKKIAKKLHIKCDTN